jgi:hypothetical protein
MASSDVHVFCRNCAYRKSRRGEAAVATCGKSAVSNFNVKDGDGKPHPGEQVCSKCQNAFQYVTCPNCHESMQRSGSLIFGKALV